MVLSVGPRDIGQCVVEPAERLLLAEDFAHLVHREAFAFSYDGQAESIHDLPHLVAMFLYPGVTDGLHISVRKVVDTGQYLPQSCDGFRVLSFQYFSATLASNDTGARNRK